jgi:serine/threonine protein phosphatase 1
MARYKEISETPKRIYAIGDLHGCYPECERLCAFLQDSQKVTAEDQIIFIGDYIDRGAESKQVIDLMLMMKRELPKTIFLKGNHEDMLLSFLGYEGTNGFAYIHNGGAPTLKSYGIDEIVDGEDVRKKLPPGHIEFFRTLDNYVVLKEYVFVHAGLHPLRDLDDQQYEDLFWIRDEFIHNLHHFDKTVVFGHTPFMELVFHLPYKIGIDTGLVYGNKLSCIELCEGVVHQIKRGAKEVQSRTVASIVEEQS